VVLAEPLATGAGPLTPPAVVRDGQPRLAVGAQLGAEGEGDIGAVRLSGRMLTGDGRGADDSSGRGMSALQGLRL